MRNSIIVLVLFCFCSVFALECKSSPKPTTDAVKVVKIDSIKAVKDTAKVVKVDTSKAVKSAVKADTTKAVVKTVKKVKKSDKK